MKSTLCYEIGTKTYFTSFKWIIPPHTWVCFIIPILQKRKLRLRVNHSLIPASSANKGWLYKSAISNDGYYCQNGIHFYNLWSSHLPGNKIENFLFMRIFRLGSQFSSHLLVTLSLGFVFFGESWGKGVRRQYGVRYSFPPIFLYLGLTVPDSVLAACGGLQRWTRHCPVLKEVTASCWQQNTLSLHKHPVSAYPVPSTRPSDTRSITLFLGSSQCGRRASGF